MGRYTALAILILILAPLAVALIQTTVVKAQTVTALVLGAGRPVTLVANFTISPGDAVAPHLYTWYFDGGDDYILVPYSSSIDITGLYTFIAWINPFSFGGYSRGRILDKNPTLSSGYIFYIENTPSAPQVYALEVFINGAPAYVSNVISLNVVQHVGAVFTGSAVNFYVNGKLVGSQSFTTYPSSNTENLYIGNRKQLDRGFNGYIAQVLIYRRALTDTEVYNVYAYNTINTTSLVLFLDPTFYNGTHYLDLSCYGNHGVGYNGVLRVIDSRTWLYLIKQRFSDGYVHFMFFPVNSIVYIYNATSGALVKSLIIKGNANVAGLVQDYPVSLTAGTYKVVVYTHQDYTFFQNFGATYTKLVAKYLPGSSLRLMVNATSGIQAIRYQIATDPNFNNIAYDNTISTSNSYIDITLPSINNTYYLRAAVQFTDDTWSPWSNTYSFRVDWLTAKIIAQSVYPTSSAPNILYNITYTDRSYPYIPLSKYNVTVASLGKYNFTSYWWRVDVYKGATTSAEPPNPSYYTYLGTVYTIHPYFSSYPYFVGTIPSSYTASYIFQGVADNTAPYWATAVGAPSTYFAFVYQSFVYLPLTGTYTIEVYSDDGVRVYINGSLVIDKWVGGIFSLSTSVNLNAGWYNVTVKYFQINSPLRFYLGIILPNGTAVRPLIPAKGIKMVAPPPPPGSSAKVVLPSVGTTLTPPLSSYVFYSASGSIPVALLTTGAVNITLVGYDLAYGYSARASTVVRFGAVVSDYSVDFVSNKVMVYIVDGLGRPVDAGYINVSDSGNLISFVKVSSGGATVSFNRFVNGTLSIVGSGDNSIIFSNPSNGVLLYKSVLSGRISAVGTQASQIMSYKALQGLVYVKAELKGNASILTNTSLPIFLVKVNGVPSNYIAIPTATGTNVILTNLGSTVEVVYANSTSASTLMGAGPQGAVYLIGFANSYNLSLANLVIGILINGSSITPYLVSGSAKVLGVTQYGIAYPVLVATSWYCEQGVPEVSWMVVYMSGNATKYAVSRYRFTSVSITCPSALYPFIEVLGNTTGVVDKYGAVVSEVLRYLASGAMTLKVVGPVTPGTFVKYVVLNQPTTISFDPVTGVVIISSGGSAPMTLVGFQGFSLSYSVAGMSVSNILISQSSFTLDLPYGVALMIVVDPSSKAVSIVQVSPIQQPYKIVATTRPVFTVSLPPPPQPQNFVVDATTVAPIVMWGAAVAVAIAATRITGSIWRGIAMASVAYALAMLGVGIFTKNLTPFMLAVIAIAVAAAAEIARRQI